MVRPALSWIVRYVDNGVLRVRTFMTEEAAKSFIQRTVEAGGEVRSWAEVWTHERPVPPALRKGRTPAGSRSAPLAAPRARWRDPDTAAACPLSRLDFEAVHRKRSKPPDGADEPEQTPYRKSLCRAPPSRQSAAGPIAGPPNPNGTERGGDSGALQLREAAAYGTRSPVTGSSTEVRAALLSACCPLPPSPGCVLWGGFCEMFPTSSTTRVPAVLLDIELNAEAVVSVCEPANVVGCLRRSGVRTHAVAFYVGILLLGKITDGLAPLSISVVRPSRDHSYPGQR